MYICLLMYVDRFCILVFYDIAAMYMCKKLQETLANEVAVTTEWAIGMCLRESWRQTPLTLSSQLQNKQKPNMFYLVLAALQWFA